MTRIFKKTYAICDTYTAEIELEDSEIEGMTEKEILELADDRLWEKASCLAPYDLADEIMDYPEERKQQGVDNPQPLCYNKDTVKERRKEND